MVPFGTQDAAERVETADGIRKVMQHARDVDEVEILGQA
jgi:hypothetical protein